MSENESITTIQRLIEELNQIEKEEDYKKAVKRLKIPVEEYEPYVFFSKKHYTRNCIVRNENYELILICWEKGQKTPVHCHNNQECWIYVVKGEFVEQRYVKSNKPFQEIEAERKMQLKKGEISYMNDNMGFHSLLNTNDGSSMSLHLYINPIDECSVFNRENGKFERKELEYYSYQGKSLQKV